MDAIRKFHNKIKKDLIVEWVKPKSYVLDCGCGRGGDFWKWKSVDARLVAVDPDSQSLKEAEERARTAEFGVWLIEGTIQQAVDAGPFDVVCYNFSIQYETEHIDLIKKAVKPGGYLIGVTPEKSLVENTKSPDVFGNTFEIIRDTLWMNVVDGPFYSDGPKQEPLLERDKFIQKLSPEFKCIVWKPISNENNVSSIYAQFVFLRNE
jgi:ubiquinone/menaquinone biosynthesis C-methylase UbiE